MNYQLPNGKVIYISIEEYLALTDADIQYLIARDYGDVVTNPFSGSAVDTKKPPEDDESREFLDLNDDGESFPDIDISDLS
jgi:hypothetical protein